MKKEIIYCDCCGEEIRKGFDFLVSVQCLFKAKVFEVCPSCRRKILKFILGDRVDLDEEIGVSRKNNLEEKV